MSYRQWAILLGVFVSSAALRLTALDRFPAPINQDELSNIYDGWSIATTGADRSGRPWPVLCHGFGPRDERPALYAWLYTPLANWTKCSVAAGRSVAAILGILTVLLAARWGWNLARFEGALISAALVGLCPWHIVYSRIAHEGASLPPFFAMLIVYLLSGACSPRNAGWRHIACWAGAGVAIGLSTSAYGATRLTGLLFAMLAAGLLLHHARQARSSWLQTIGRVVLLIAAVTLGAAPQLWALVHDPIAFLGRAGEVRICTNSVPTLVARVVENALANFDLAYLFWKFGHVNNLSVARCSVVTLPFFLWGVVTLVRWKAQWSIHDRLLLLVGAVICVAPAAITHPNPHALRASGCSVLIPLITAVGMIQIALRVRAPKPVTWSALFVFVLVIGLGWDLYRYLKRPDLWKSGHQPEVVQIAQWLNAHAKEYDRVYIENRHIQPSLYIAAMSGVTPREFQSASKQEWNVDREQFERFGNYWFSGARGARDEWSRSEKDERWLVITTDGVLLRTYGPRLPEPRP